MGDCNKPDGSCQPVRYEQAQPTYQQPAENWCQTAASDAWKGKGTTISYDGQTKPQYDKMVEQFKYNADKGPGEKNNVQDAYDESAKTGKPIVFVIGKFDGNNTKDVTKLLNNADAICVYVDPDKCNDPKLKAFAENELKGGHNASVAVVYSMNHDKDGNRELTREYRLQGGHQSMQPELLDKIAKAKREPEGPSAAELKATAEAKEKAAKEATEKAAKEAAEKSAKEAAEKSAKEAAEKSAKEAAEKSAKEAAEKSAKEAAEKSAKEAAEKAAKDAELKAALDKARAEGKAEGKAEARKEIAVAAAVIAAPGIVIPAIAGAKVAEVIAENPVQAAKVAAVIVAPGIAIPAIAGAKVAEVIAENPVQAAKVAAVIAAPGIAIPAMAGAKVAEVIAENPVQAAKVAAVIAVPQIAIPAMAGAKVVEVIAENPVQAAKVGIALTAPVIPIAIGTARVARKVYDWLPDAPDWAK